ERLRDFPVRVGSLSRFRSRPDQLKTVAELAEGRVDVVIGTHRLLSRDVRWKNLGLVVIDEEQRFGVTHKERLKEIRSQVDVLTRRCAEVQALAPQARVAMGHGQMGEGELERVMIDFVDGKCDILCCTTIIEAGLDIPRANTMIVNNADRFGLAQLYQLRGRIGRARDRAFCYLVVPAEGTMTSDAKQRLAVLQRFTELGAGFQVATHDLEIRGAGE